MKFVGAMNAFVFATGMAVAEVSFALGSAIVVAPSGPAAEAEGASEAAQARMSSKQTDHAKNQHATHAASGPAANRRQTPQ